MYIGLSDVRQANYLHFSQPRVKLSQTAFTDSPLHSNWLDYCIQTNFSLHIHNSLRATVMIAMNVPDGAAVVVSSAAGVVVSITVTHTHTHTR